MSNLINRLRKFFKPQQQSSYHFVNGVITWNGNDSISQVNDGYAGNDIVYSVINLISQKAKVPDWHVYKCIDKEKAKRYKQLIANPSNVKDWKEVLQLKEESYEIYTGNARLNELIEYPNKDQTFANLVEGHCIYKMATGNGYLYGKLIEAGVNKGMPLSLHNLPSQYIAIVANTGQYPNEVTGYNLFIGTYEGFSREEVLHDKFFNPIFSINGSELYGLSPLKAASKVLTRSNEGRESTVASYQNGGPAGVLSIKNNGNFDPLDVQAQVDRIKESLRQYKGSSNRNKLATSGYEAAYTQIGANPVDMAIFDAEKFDMRAICNIYGVPSQLLNDPDNKIQANAVAAEKALTTRAALPFLISFRDELNRKLQTDWGVKDKNLVVDFDMSCFSELHENTADQVNYLNEAWWISPYQKYQIMDMTVPEYLDEEELKKIYIPQNLVPQDEILELPKGLNPYEK